MPDSDLFTARRWTHPWQVIRDFRDGFPVVVICSHRTEWRAFACALRQDAWALISSGFAPRWHADVRRNPTSAARSPIRVIVNDSLPDDTAILTSGVSQDEIRPGESVAEAMLRLNRTAVFRDVDPQ